VAYSIKDGLPSDASNRSALSSMERYGRGSYQLTLFDTRAKQFTIYDQGDGLPDQNTTGGKCSLTGKAENHFYAIII
jgi:hypothetical protein